MVVLRERKEDRQDNVPVVVRVVTTWFIPEAIGCAFGFGAIGAIGAVDRVAC